MKLLSAAYPEAQIAACFIPSSGTWAVEGVLIAEDKSVVHLRLRKEFPGRSE